MLVLVLVDFEVLVSVVVAVEVDVDASSVSSASMCKRAAILWADSNSIGFCGSLIVHLIIRLCSIGQSLHSHHQIN